MTWATERLNALKAGTVEPPAIVARLGLGFLDDWGAGWVKKTWEPAPDIQNADGSMFGGYIAALADQVFAFAAMSVVSDGSAFRTINLAVQFFRIARNEPIFIEAKVVAQTKQLISVEAEFKTSGDRLIAKASAQQMIVDFPAA